MRVRILLEHIVGNIHKLGRYVGMKGNSRERGIIGLSKMEFSNDSMFGRQLYLAYLHVGSVHKLLRQARGRGVCLMSMTGLFSSRILKF